MFVQFFRCYKAELAAFVLLSIIENAILQVQLNVEVLF